MAAVKGNISKEEYLITKIIDIRMKWWLKALCYSHYLTSMTYFLEHNEDLINNTGKGQNVHTASIVQEIRYIIKADHKFYARQAIVVRCTCTDRGYCLVRTRSSSLGTWTRILDSVNMPHRATHMLLIDHAWCNSLMLIYIFTKR